MQHTEIANFPSEQFYEGRLTCGNKEQQRKSKLRIWPGGSDKPAVFLDIGGEEEFLTVPGAEGSMRSCSNLAQVRVAVSAY